MDDVRAVMDAAGSERAVLFGHSEGGPMCLLFAAAYPERTEGLVIYGSFAVRLRQPDYPWAPTAEERERHVRRVRDEWGGAGRLDELAPGVMRDDEFRRLVGQVPALECQPCCRRGSHQHEQRRRRALRPAVYHRPDPRHPPWRRPARRRRRCPLAGGANPRGPLRRAAGERPPHLGRPRPDLRPRRGVRDRRPTGRGAQPRAPDRPVHRHRRLHGDGRRPRRRCLAASARPSRRDRPPLSSSATGGERSSRPATGSWPSSTAPRAPSAAPRRSPMPSSPSVCRSGPVCTRGRWSCAARTSAESPFTPPRG